MVLGRGRNEYLVTILYETDEGVRNLLIVEVRADTMIEGLRAVTSLTTGEIVTCVKVRLDFGE